MRKIVSHATFVVLLSLTLVAVSAQEDMCHVDSDIMTTEEGIEFVRTPDACFENLPDWPYEAKYVEIDGLRQAYVDVGSGDSGETILLLHGQPSWSYLYRKMIPVLADEGHRVIAMDHLGFGRSDKPIDPDYYTYVGHVERLETFIEELELVGVTPFVQDWGSLIGLQVVGTNPDWFDRLIVGNGFLPTFPEGTVPFQLPDNPEVTRNLFHQAITNIPAQQEPLVREPLDVDDATEFSTEGNFFGLWIDYARNDERFRPEVIVESQTYFDLSPEEEAAYAAPFPSRLYMGGARAFPGLVNELPGVTDSGWAGLGEFDKPFLTIWGDNDGGNLGQPFIQRALVEHIPGSEGWDHVRLEEASHFLQDDQGEEIARRVNAFIEQASEGTDFDTSNTSPLVPGPNDSGLYTTVNAAEHADDGRSHVFEYATFGGSLHEDAMNTAVIRNAPGFYPGAYNVVTRNENEIFVYYGVYGEVEGATGPAVARLDANTLEEVWNVQLAVLENETAWNYPGVIGMHGNGTLVVISANIAAVIDPDTGNILNQVDLPQDNPVVGSYNGFATTSDGTLFTKALFRSCDTEGSPALTDCLATDVTQTLLAIDPVTLDIISEVELPDFSTGRVPTAVHDGIDYVYMPGINSSYRYRWEAQTLTLDEDWGFVSIAEEDDSGAMAPNVIGDWVFVQVNTGTPKPMPVWAISTIDSSQRFLIQPFEDIETRFSFGVAHGAFDPISNLYFTADTGTGYIAAMQFDPERGFEVVWREEQTTSVFQQLIGTPEERVVVTSELINLPLNPLRASNEQVVFRDAATGRELARTGDLPRMTQGSNISPGFGGRVYFIGVDGVLYEITVQSE